MRYYKLACIGLILCSVLVSRAQVPPVTDLLPSDTIGVGTIPDYQKLASFYDQSPFGRLWSDPAMKPFREKFMAQLKKEVIEPLEKELGVSVSEYKDLLQGQVTLALTPPTEGSDELFSALLLIDTKDKAEALTTRLADLRKKWSESGKELRTETIRGTEFTRVSFTKTDIENFLESTFPSQGEDEEEEETTDAEEKTELYIGQAKSLFIAGEDPKAIEKVLARQGGGELPPLAEQSNFQVINNRIFRNSLAFGWLNFSPIYEAILKSAAEEEAGQEPTPGMPRFEAAKVLPALGVDSLKALGASLSGGAEGSSLDGLVTVPEAQRRGIFKILTLENKPSGPPAFVPADVVKFQRVRLDAQKAWNELEAMLNNVDPGMVGMLQLMLGAVEAAGQQQDPNFSFKKNFIGNLGDDFITYEKLPRGNDLEALATPPSLALLGSPRPIELAEAMRFVMMLAPVSGPPEEREFLGKKIYSIKMAVPTAQPSDEVEEEEDEAPAVQEQTLSFAASGEYVAISADAAILEEYIRSSGTPGKPLREVSGLAEAAQKAGGMDTGLFSYENQKESYRVLWEAIKKNPELLQQGIFQFRPEMASGESGMKDWFDFSLLPSFDQVSKYFGIAVMTLATTPDGYLLRAYGPTPAEMR